MGTQETLMTPEMIGLYVIFAGAFGVCIGSFLNVCIWRMPRGESVVFVPSHCPKCEAPIRAWQNIPIVSYILLRGRCRHCKTPISPRYWLVEALTGVLFMLLAWNGFAAGATVGMVLTFLAVMPLVVAGTFIDIEHRLIPDALTYPTALTGVVLAGFFPENWFVGNWLKAVFFAASSWVIVYLVLWVLAWGGKKLFKAEAFGAGDIKFVAAAATVLGWQTAPVILLVGSLAGSFFGIGVAVRHKRKLSGVTIAFAPWLALGVLAWCLLYPWVREYLRIQGL